MDPVTALRTSTYEQTQPALRVLVVDDQLLYAEAISVLLGQQEGLEVVGIAGDGREATRVVVLTALTGDEHVERALGAGADACIKKFSRGGDLVTAIEQLA